MTRNDVSLLVIASSIAGQRQDFSGEIFKNSGEVNCNNASQSKVSD